MSQSGVFVIPLVFFGLFFGVSIPLSVRDMKMPSVLMRVCSRKENHVNGLWSVHGISRCLIQNLGFHFRNSKTLNRIKRRKLLLLMCFRSFFSNFSPWLPLKFIRCCACLHVRLSYLVAYVYGLRCAQVFVSIWHFVQFFFGLDFFSLRSRSLLSSSTFSNVFS